MKYAADKPYGDPEMADRKLIEIANAPEAVQDGRINIEQINRCYSSTRTALPNTRRGLALAIERGWLVLDRSGAYVKSRAGREVVRLTASQKENPA
jgi:hypothetical protein